MAAQTEASAKVRLKGQRGRLAIGALGILVVVIAGVVALFALHYADERQQEVAERLRALQAASERATDAQIAFKLQVQEWKNSLLRGGSQLDYEHHRRAMEAQAAVVRANLTALAEGSGAGGQRKEAAAALANHEDLLARYQEGFLRFESDGRADPTEVDALVRGIDRPLDRKLDLLAAGLRKVTDETLRRARESAIERYDRLRYVVLATHGLGALLLLLLLLAALPDTRSPR